MYVGNPQRRINGVLTQRGTVLLLHDYYNKIVEERKAPPYPPAIPNNIGSYGMRYLQSVARSKGTRLKDIKKMYSYSYDRPNSNPM